MAYVSRVLVFSGKDIGCGAGSNLYLLPEQVKMVAGRAAIITCSSKQLHNLLVGDLLRAVSVNFRTEATTFAEQIDASSFITLPAPELSPSEHKVGEVSYVATDKCCPFGPRQSSAREEGWNAKHSCRSHNRNVDGDERSFHGDRFARNQHRQPKNDCNIIDTAAQKIAYRDLALIAYGRDDCRDQFRARCADCNVSGKLTPSGVSSASSAIA